MKIGDNDDVLDLGCGSGHLTRKIRGLTNGKVVGIDPSEGMIKEAVEKSKRLDITYEIKSAEDMDYEESFDVIFCNSAFQWFKDPEKASGRSVEQHNKHNKLIYFGSIPSPF